MKIMHSSRLDQLVEGVVGVRAHRVLREAVELPADLLGVGPGPMSRGEIAMGLALVLFDDLCDRVPLAAAYTHECIGEGRKLMFDHGAMRCVAAPSGLLPQGRRAVARILEPLGYAETLRYDLSGLGMTGYVYTHLELSESIPQYFVSELHPERFSPAFQAASAELLSTSVDPLSAAAQGQLDRIERGSLLDLEDAQALLARLRGCFDRHHRQATVDEYELFAGESAEMAWIATEGHAFNHITDRVANVSDVARVQRELGRPVKDEVEVSRSGRVVQTALRAAQVERLLRVGNRFVPRSVAGSFLEFISRERLENGALDLAFDAQNAQGIFTMTNGNAR